MFHAKCEVTSQNLWSRYDRCVVGITWHDVWILKAKFYDGVIHIKLNQLVYENKRIFKRYYSNQHFSDFYPQNGGGNQLV